MKRQSEVMYPGYEPAVRMLAIGKLLCKSLSGAQVADRLRQIFTLVVRLPDDLVASFALDNVDERRSQIMDRVYEVHSSFEPVLEWIERRRFPGSSSRLENQLKWVFCEVVDCATHDIPEYAGGAPKLIHIGDPSAGWRRAHNLDLRIQRLAVSLIAWAETIEDEELARRPKTAVRTKKSTSKGDAQTKIIGALSAYHQFDGDDCLNLEPIGNNELARLAEVSTSTVSLFIKQQFAEKDASQGVGRQKYRAACSNGYRLAVAIKKIRDELTPTMLWNSLPDDH